MTISTQLNTECSEITLNERFESAKWKFIATLFTLGLINNNGFVMVMAGADLLAKGFDKEKLMPAFQLSLIIFSSLTRIVNSKWLIRMQHISRIMMVVFFIVASFIIIAFCCFYDTVDAMFYVSLLTSILVGVGCALGESVILGFLKTFPGDSIGYYSSGTGMAGITGALIFIALKPLGLSNGAIYLIAAPTAIPYFLSFYWLNKQKM